MATTLPLPLLELESDSSETFAVENPATGETLAHLPRMGTTETRRALERASAALPAWRALLAKDRARILRRWADSMLEHENELAELLTLEQGKPVAESHAEVQYGASFFEWFGEEAKRVYGDTIPTYAPDRRVVVTKEPVGVTAGITPWNFPAAMPTRKAAPALAAGCTMVLKPSEITPLNAIILAEIFDKAGVPAGVFNLVNGDGPTVGAAIASHPGIDMVSFTGSTRAGIQVAKNAADTVKRVTQELGGKSANIILEDADLAKAVSRGVQACFQNSGQSCNAPTRMFVPAAKHAEALKVAKAAAEKVVPGDPASDAMVLGPVASKIQFDKIQGLIAKGIQEGAELVCGGPGRPQGLEKGYFVKPTVFGNVRNNMTVAREEIFGPVLCILPYQSEEEAVAMANDTPYGLSGYVQSGDVQHAVKVATRLRTGNVHINGAGPDFAAPFGGYKQSGNGREWGAEGFEEFLETKAVLGAAA